MELLKRLLFSDEFMPHLMSGDRRKYLEAGFNEYLSKPVSTDALVEAIRKWL